MEVVAAIRGPGLHALPRQVRGVGAAAGLALAARTAGAVGINLGARNTALAVTAGLIAVGAGSAAAPRAVGAIGVDGLAVLAGGAGAVGPVEADAIGALLVRALGAVRVDGLARSTAQAVTAGLETAGTTGALSARAAGAVAVDLGAEIRGRRNLAASATARLLAEATVLVRIPVLAIEGTDATLATSAVGAVVSTDLDAPIFVRSQAPSAAAGVALAARASGTVGDDRRALLAALAVGARAVAIAASGTSAV